MTTTSTEQGLDEAFQKRLLERIHSIPAVNTLGFRVEHMAPGECHAVVPRDSAMDGIYESFHGGLLMTVADMAACFAVMTLTGPEQMMTTTDMNIRFLAPCLTEVRAVAKVIKAGRSLCPSGVELFDAGGNRVAVAQVTYMRLEKMPSR